MSKFERPLITRIVDTGDIRSARKSLVSDCFYTPDGRQAWNYLAEYFVQHGTTPSREMLAEAVPNFEFAAMATDPVAALVDRVDEFHVYNQLSVAVERVAELAKTDTRGAATYLSEQAMRFRTMAKGTGNDGVDITARVQEEVDSYFRRKDLRGILGVAWPWPRMNRATFGIQDGQLVVFYARPKNMKTWLLLYTLHHIHYHAGRKVLLFTREMTKEELQRRYCAVWAGVDYERYLSGKLTNMEEKRWLEAMEAFAEAPPVVLDTVPGSGEEAADEMIAKAQELGADVMGVDGIYFFGNREWEQIARFTTRLKYHLLNTHKIPCIGTTQGVRHMSKASDTLDDVGYGDSVSQDADILIKCVLLKEDERLQLSLPGIREGKSCEFQVWARPAYDFTQAFAEEGHEDEVRNAGEVTNAPVQE